MFKCIKNMFFKIEFILLWLTLFLSVSVSCWNITNYLKTQWHKKTAKHIIINDLWIRNLSTVQWRQLLSIPHGIGWGISTGASGSLSSPPCGLSRWSLIIHYTRLSFSLTWHWDCSKEVKEEVARYLKALTWKSDSVTFATFCWSKQVTGPSRNQVEGKRFHLLMEE